ncbi:MAG: 1-(5-phosphoribosyl)-5-[(5-phosphoribosylamino)methylideneamino]imidazole-4-carboxamide isomerase [Oscillospiraceae bacterium]|nr:1-(5-phosphoribosyl)-5-[(5-phosphoribosylamino)methylideneamino]imidazole-4-carboxamide isomerase [Oscillospiraceae bacterium]
MDLFPAIDLCGAKAVRLLRGDYNEMTVYSDAPLEVALDFKSAGAEYLHLVDLDGAKDGATRNFEVIGKIVADSGLKVEVGGGIRNINTVQQYIDLGVMRVIIGTSAVTDPGFLLEAIKRFGDKIAVAVDIKNGMVATHGWTQTSTESCFDFCQKLQDIGVKTIICTDISKDGAMQGVNQELYENLTARFSMDIIASGGVTTIDDLIKLAETRVRGAILGKSIYTGSIDLKSAVATINKAVRG